MAADLEMEADLGFDLHGCPIRVVDADSRLTEAPGLRVDPAPARLKELTQLGR